MFFLGLCPLPSQGSRVDREQLPREGVEKAEALRFALLLSPLTLPLPADKVATNFTPIIPAARDLESCACMLISFSGVRLFATPWTVAHQAPPSVGFFSNNTGVGCPARCQGIFPSQGSNPRLLRLLHWQVLYP